MTSLIPVSQPSISELEISYVTDAVKSGWVSSLGTYIEDFERSFAEFCGTKYALTVSNGTTGLHLALLAVGIGPGDEVIIPDLTFIATANAIAYTGARPVMVDIEPETLCLDPGAVERAITPRTRAIIPVHLYGHPAAMDAINAIASKHDLVVIEDAAEAHGARYRGKRVGSLGRCGVFSFYGNKIITTGEGGMITTNDEVLCQTAKRLRDHAMHPKRRYWHAEIGYNYRMTNLQAALGMAQLQRIDEFSRRRRQIMAWYRAGLGHHADLRLNCEASWATNAYWMVCLEVDGMNETSRQNLMANLRSRGVDSRPYFYPISDMPMYPSADTPIVHRISPRGINLPTFVALSREQVDYICATVQEAVGELKLERRKLLRSRRARTKTEASVEQSAKNMPSRRFARPLAD
jgi:perosamine synthetase